MVLPQNHASTRTCTCKWRERTAHAHACSLPPPVACEQVWVAQLRDVCATITSSSYFKWSIAVAIVLNTVRPPPPPPHAVATPGSLRLTHR